MTQDSRENNELPKMQQEALKNISVGGDLSVNNIIQQQITNNYLGHPASISQHKPLERNSWLELQLQRSRERCIARWQSLGVSREKALQLLEDSTIGIHSTESRFPIEKISILVGDIGSGKTLIAERIYQSAIQAAQQDSEAPIPVYFDSGDVQKFSSLEEGIHTSLQLLCDPQAAKLLVLVDGIDETGLSRSNKVIEEARILVHVHRNLAVIITSRPTPQVSNAEEVEEVQLLPQNNAYKLVNFIAGKTIHGLSASLNRDVKEAIKRPLFAILLGAYLKENSIRKLNSKEQLLVNLVERSLSPFSEEILKLSDQLEFLAIQSINNGGMSVPVSYISTWSDRHKLLESRLVVQDGDGLRFPLPLITQWLAAQSLNSGKIKLEQLVEDSQKLEFWQYPLVIAIVTFDPNRVTEILSLITEKHPFIAATIIQEAFSNQFRVIYREQKIPLPSPIEIGRHVRQALQAWYTGLDHLGKFIMPLDRDGNLFPIGIGVSEKPLEPDPSEGLHQVEEKAIWIKFVWGIGSEAKQELVVFPTGLEVSDSVIKDSSCIRQIEFLLFEQSSWYWKFSLEEIISLLSDLLSRRGFPITDNPIESSKLESNWHQLPPLTARLPPTHVSFTPPLRHHDYSASDSYLVSEGAWHAAYFLTRGYSSNINLDPISLLEIERALEKVNNYYDALGRGIDPLRLNQLTLELEHLYDVGQENLFYPWANNFSDSPHEILQHVNDVYRVAIKEYRKLVLKWFPVFNLRLETFSRFPARLKGILVFDSLRGGNRGLSWYWEVLPSKSDSEVDIVLGDRPIPQNEPHFQKTFDRMRSLRPENFAQQSSIELFSGDRQAFSITPVTDIVYGWLWEDLGKIGWTKGRLNKCGLFGINF